MASSPGSSSEAERQRLRAGCRWFNSSPSGSPEGSSVGRAPTQTRRRSRGSSPAPRISFKWGQKLGHESCPYLVRWVADFGLFSVRVHHWLASDDQRFPHDHPWAYVSLILSGGYTDKSPSGDAVVRRGSVIARSATHQHSVIVNPGGCWTLLLAGPETREWGFWVRGRFRHRNKYFHEHGHHPCERA